MIDKAKALKLTNALMSGAAGFASFVFSLAAFLYLKELDQQIVASVVAGIFCLMVCYIAAERPNSASARAMMQLRRRLLDVARGDLTSPAPEGVRRTLPDVAKAVDALFSEVRNSIDNAYALGMFDPVTSLPNRLQFRREVDAALESRPPDARAAMLFIDLDRFKTINDRFGHARGDKLLVMVADRLREAVRPDDEDKPGPLLARLAGDEFTIFMRGLTDESEAERLADRIVDTLSAPFDMSGQRVIIGASIGIAISPDFGTTPEELMRAADLAMYRAKANGGGRHVLFSASLAKEHERSLDMEGALLAGLERNEFSLVLQPQLDLRSGDITGAEALLRWHPDTEELVKPAEFIALAERCGLIGPIGRWVIDESADILSRWIEAGHPRRLAINVSPCQLDAHDFFDALRRTYKRRNVPLSLLELEFTETTAMHCTPDQVTAIEALRAEGVSIAIDDFGTGFSNLARLRSLPLDRVKLDPAMCEDIETSQEARDLVAAVIAMVHAVGAQCIAEAVETAAQADILRAMGCQSVQGFVFAPPMSERDLFECCAHAARARDGRPDLRSA